jgi:hypothetical protein
MKIIRVDNFARETVPDALVAESIKNEDYARCMVNALNTKFSGDQSSNYYKIVSDEYKLRTYEDIYG